MTPFVPPTLVKERVSGLTVGLGFVEWSCPAVPRDRIRSPKSLSSSSQSKGKVGRFRMSQEDDAATLAAQEAATAQEALKQEVTDAKAEAKTARDALATATNESERIKTEAAEARARKAEEDVAAAEAAAAAIAAGGTPPAEGAKTFDEGYVKKLREEAASHRTRAAEAAARVKELEDAGKSESERNAERAAEAERKAAAAERRLLQIEVATKKKVPLDMADRLVGDNKEDLEKDADKFLKAVTPSGGGFDQGSRGPGGSGKPPGKDWIRSMAGFERR